MTCSVRLAQKTDMADVLQLIKELAHFEKEPDAVELTVTDLERDGFGETPAFTCFVAENQDQIIAMALVYMRYSTWKGPALHLEDLIVKKDLRGEGIGGLLLDEVVKHGHKLGVKRICWEVLDWNESAIAFYKQRGAKVKREWDVVQLDEQGIRNYISNL
ncbi:GNAT family N-acetyltransferase [Mangrovimonas aestuarii]|uniref:GNAT family N-acetyltransferase n=1 Tax=Mangrovimonas aestuarii TaxID=3018443 RepID=UPI002379FC69|nr:GNAT family N-acetyltransferase [Mangrovimonas aestuarii]